MKSTRRLFLHKFNLLLIVHFIMIHMNPLQLVMFYPPKIINWLWIWIWNHCWWFLPYYCKFRIHSIILIIVITRAFITSPRLLSCPLIWRPIFNWIRFQFIFSNVLIFSLHLFPRIFKFILKEFHYVRELELQLLWLQFHYELVHQQQSIQCSWLPQLVCPHPSIPQTILSVSV